MNAFGASGPVAAPSNPGSAASAPVGASQPKPIASPVAPALWRNTRRDTNGAMVSWTPWNSMSRRRSSSWKRFIRGCMVPPLTGELRRGGVDGRTDALVGRATTDVACHRVIDVGVARPGLSLARLSRRHDLSRLAVAALHDVEIHPRFLHRLRCTR